MPNCKNCKHCKYEDSNMSPSSILMVTDYVCKNELSGSFGNKMNVVFNAMSGREVDSRTNNTCDKIELK